MSLPPEIEPVHPPAGEEELLEGRFRQTLENVAMVAIALDLQGRITFANAFFLELTGWSRDEVIGADWFELFDDDPEVRADYLARVSVGDMQPHFEGKIRTRAGKRHSISWSTTLQRDDAGAPVGIVSIGEDVTERRRAEEALRSREELFRSLIENASDVITIIDPGGTTLYASPAVERVLGRSPEELVGTVGFDLLHEDDVVLVREALDAILAGEERGPTRFRLRNRDGSWRTCEGVGHRRDEEAGPVIVVNYRDVTDQILLQEQLFHARKLEAIGQLAGGIAHDFNNLLTAIGGYGDLLASSLDPDDPRRGDALEIVRAAERAASLTNQLLTFSRRQMIQVEVHDLGEVVAGLGRLLTRLLGEGISLSTEVGAGCWVKADRGQLEQIVTNLAVNARDAMPAGGRLELAASAGDGVVELRVTDTGVGMDETTLSHAFEPFFTTKEPGKGTGLGLATVYGIVTQAAGRISIASEPGSGTTVSIVLPRSAEGPAGAEEGTTAGSRQGNEGILVAEDEETIRRLVTDVLSRSGYTVYAAANGDEALALLREHGAAISLLLTDVVMPGMSGPDLARAACLLRPGLRVLFTSGYSSEPDEALDDPAVAFIGKPFSPEAIAAKVREVLDERG